MYVSRLNSELGKLGLLNIRTGKFNSYTLRNDTNEYSVNYFSNAKWSGKKEIKPIQEKAVKAKPVLTDVHKHFLEFCEYAKPIFQEKGYLNDIRQKISVRQIP